VIGRDHLDSGSVASPYRETEAMADGSDAIADWPLLNALLNTASGASWVSIHHGGGVGIGRSIHAGQVTVADGTALAAEKLERVLTNDPGTGVMRHVDAGYERAREVARERGLTIPMLDTPCTPAGHEHRRADDERRRRRRRPRRRDRPHPRRRDPDRGRSSRGSGARPTRSLADVSAVVVDAEGRAVVPGFVDSHTHLVFAATARTSSRRAWPASRMPPAASVARSPRRGPRPTTSCARVWPGSSRAARPGHDDVRGEDGLRPDRRGEARSRASPRRSPTRSPSSARTSCPPSTRAIATPTSTSSAAPCSTRCAPSPGGSTSSARPARSRPPRAAILRAGRDAGLGGVHGNQLGYGAARGSRPRSTASVDHCTYLSDEDVRLLAASDVVATLLPGVEFSTRQPYPDARRLIDAGVTVALASDCNPGTSFTSSAAHGRSPCARWA
jgi:hypothetical protein